MSPHPSTAAATSDDGPPPAPRPEQLASPPGSKDSQEPDESRSQGTAKEEPSAARDTERAPVEVPTFEELDGFVWENDYDGLLGSLASTGLASATHQGPAQYFTLCRILIYRLRHAVQSYLAQGDDTLFDARQDPGASNGWIWESKEVERAVNRVKEAMLEFDRPEAWVGKDDQGLSGLAEAPFTLQRLAELLAPWAEGKRTHPHYNTLPKYLRALSRVLGVTSPLAAFPIDTYALPTLASNAVANETLTNGGPSATPSPASIRPRRHSTSTPVTPLLTPIPWLVSDAEADAMQALRGSSPASLHLNGSSSPPSPSVALPMASQAALSSHLSPPSMTAAQRALSPPGRVDELDPGLGTAEEMEDGPIAIGSTPLSPRVEPLAPKEGDDVEMRALDALAQNGEGMELDI